MRLGSLTHVQLVVEDVLSKGIPGDLIEAGCYRCATCIIRVCFLLDFLLQRGDWCTDAGCP